LLALLFAGTAAGAYLDEHMGSAVALMSVVFLPSLGLAIKRLHESGAESRTAAEECGQCAQAAAQAAPGTVRPAVRDAS
jgi:hypothetical protein